MNAIIGAWATPNRDTSSISDAMLDALKHRGTFGRMECIGTEEGGIILGSLSHSGTAQEFARSRTRISVLNGTFYGQRTKNSAAYVLRCMSSKSALEAIRRVIREDGGFAGLVGEKNRLFAFRDVNGFKPLYFAHSRQLTAFASERKALWRVGLMHAEAIAPGSMVIVTPKDVGRRQMVSFQRPRESKISFQQASFTLHRLLTASIRNITRRAGRVCVAFSGGLDSALTAAMTKTAGVDIDAISVGLDDSPEILTAEKFASELGLRITRETFPAGSIEEYVRKVLWLIEEPNMMKLSVAIPLHWAAMVAARCGYEVMLCGQGSDELYGGYNKYAITLRLHGRRALSDQLYKSVIESSTVNYERDDQATSTFPVELRTPFADPELIRFSLRIPTEFKVKDGNDVTRKWVLRDVARKVGLPDDIVWRRKKAIQHGTGVEKAILNLAKRYGLKPEEYLLKTFHEVRMMSSIP